ncbi:MAG: Gfo/Idh/MocA family oxidoreductase [Pirellulaceae bacterium]
MSQQPKASTSTRRSFLKKSSILVAGSAVGGSLTIAQAAHPFGTDTIKVGLVGCGGRGTGAAIQAMNTSGGDVHLVAMGDVFDDRLQGSYRSIKGKHGDKVKVTKDTQFVGYDAFEQVLGSEIDMIILATPPGFRPMHFEAAVKAGKNVFMEKPVATDAPGVRRVLEANKIAKEKGLAVQVGLQRRHEVAYRETMMKIKEEGLIGDIILTRAYWNSGGVWVRPRQEKQTELEYQMRNWYYFNWLCGDHIDEQHIHNIDVINWLMDGFPVTAQGQGGREVRNGDDHGQIFDHHFVEFTYDNGTKFFSQCRHIRKCYNSVSEHAHGTKGYADISGGKIYNPSGEMVWKTNGSRGGHQEEHHDLFRDLRAGNIPNEAEYGAMSTMTSIFGRMATYSGQLIKWDDAIGSELALADFDSLKSMDNEAPVKPNDDGSYPCPIPGESKVI